MGTWSPVSLFLCSVCCRSRVLREGKHYCWNASPPTTQKVSHSHGSPPGTIYSLVVHLIDASNRVFPRHSPDLFPYPTPFSNNPSCLIGTGLVHRTPLAAGTLRVPARSHPPPDGSGL